MTHILSIETSCDDTGVAVLQKSGDEIKVLSSLVSSQADIHAVTGGIIPEVAAREHMLIINALIKQVLVEAGEVSLDAIAVTVGPGLMPALLVGVQTARTLSYAWGIPIVPVHHIEGHIYSALLEQSREFPISNFSRFERDPAEAGQFANASSFPALALIVSGGHTMLIKLTGHLQYEVLGQTRDDAAGEAFDKVARLLGLGYPGGPAISQLAEAGDAAAYNFTRPMMNSGDLDFSFSGLKTELLYTLRDLENRNEKFSSADIAASFQLAAVDSLIIKTRQALLQDNYQMLLLAGGVAANSLLREKMKELSLKQDIKLQVAPLPLCGDNAIMIGLAGLMAYEAGAVSSWQETDAYARINLENFRNLDGAQSIANIQQH